MKTQFDARTTCTYLQDRKKLFKEFFEEVLDIQGMHDPTKVRSVHTAMGIDDALSQRMIDATPRALLVSHHHLPSYRCSHPNPHISNRFVRTGGCHSSLG